MSPAPQKKSATRKKTRKAKPRQGGAKAASARKKPKAKSSKSVLKKLAWLVLSFALLALAAHVIYLNHLIEQRFDGETWARPSRVYARPLELYSGLKITAQQLQTELKLADYQAVKKVTQPGQYHRSGQRWTIYSRDFYFPDHHQTAAIIELYQQQNEVIQISDQSSQTELDFFQLTPALIGSYLPGNGEDRRVIEASDIPPELKKILLAVEDRKFYSHFGVNPLSILRALWANIRAGKTVQGGSTLTQQLAKNLFLTPERSLLRKINEALMALLLELRFDKESILAAYINEVFLLQQNNTSVHGFALASRLLFKQPLPQLGREKLALLVGMVKGPSLYNPLLHPARATHRRNQVLKILRDENLISAAQLKTLQAKPLGVVKKLPPVNPYPAYLDLVKRQLTSNYSSSDLASKGLVIFSAFDPLKQQQLERGLGNGLNRFSNKNLQAAVIIADYLNGDLVAMTGDRNAAYPGFNRAILAQRPIGSLIKPMLLYGFLQQGKTLATLVEDKPISVRQSDGKLWQPQNYDRKLHGKMTLYKAFIKSYNLPFVRLGLKSGGLKTLVENLSTIHLQKLQHIYPSILLGALPMTPLEVTQLYQVIANSGYFAPLTTIREVMNGQHQLLNRVPLQSQALFDRVSMIQVQRALIGVTEAGTARYLKSRFKDKTFAGKTGTTNDLRDSWFAGFSNRYLGVVWLGDDANKSINLTGSSGALRVWADIMAQLDASSLKLSADPKLEWKTIDIESGGLTSPSCENSALLPFVKGAAPDFRSACRTTNALEKGINWLQKLLQ